MFTFLLPAYKSAFLDEALRSIQEQTYTNFKVLISDDCSHENIHAICEPYLNDLRFSYRRNERNMGSKNLVSHWNLLVSLCDTEYCIMASDDDVYDTAFLDRINELTYKYPIVDLFRARTRKINEDGESYAIDCLYEEKEEPLEFLYSSFSQERTHCIGNYVFRTETLKKNGGFVDFLLGWFSDDATVSLCSFNGVVNTNDILFCFRNSHLNITYPSRKDPKMALEKIDASCRFYDWMNDFISSVPYSNTLYYNTMFERVREGYKYRVKWLINTYYHQLGLSSFIKLIRRLKENGLLSSNIDLLYFVMRWIKQKL